MFCPFPTEIAHQFCLRLIQEIKTGEIFVEQTARESEERKGQGVMLGCLVVWDKTEQKRKILFTVSGNSKTIKKSSSHFQMDNCEVIFVQSLVSQKEIDKALYKNDYEIHRLTDIINREKANSTAVKNDHILNELIQQRTQLTDESLRKVFSLYNFTRFDGKTVTLNKIISSHAEKLPPTGTGDCCAPKLLSYAFKNNYLPVSLDEIYFGKETKNKKNGKSYPPCDERCAYILPEIMGLEILYRDNDIVVVNKQSGLLSVAGRGEEKYDCVEYRLKCLFPDCILQPAVHRLDMETSGILILALNKKAHRNLEMQFAENDVHKKYVALLDGILYGKGEGHIELKSRLDLENRPVQIVDEINGKLGITDWKKIGVETFKNKNNGLEQKVTRIEFYPKTGRTHQLRLAASNIKGLNIPILGDSLYGQKDSAPRLMLHSFEVTFNHPESGKQMTISCKSPF